MTEDQPSIAALVRACLTAVPAQRMAFDGSFVVRAFWEVHAARMQREDLTPGLTRNYQDIAQALRAAMRPRGYRCDVGLRRSALRLMAGSWASEALT